MLASFTVVAVAGCGGDSGETYSLEASRPCLSDVGVTSATVDYIADDASGGAVRVVVDGKEAMVAFGARQR